MTKKRKSFMLLISMVLVLALLVGCGSGKTQEPAAAGTEEAAEESGTENTGTAAETEKTDDGGDYHITFVTPLIGHDSWLQAKDALFEAGEDLGFEAEWVGPADGNVDEMINYLEIAISQNVSGIITQGQNPEAMVSVLTKAYEAGIPVCVIDSPIEDAPQLGYIGFDLEAGAKIGVEAAYEHFGADAEINALFLTTNIDYTAATTAYDYYCEYLEEYYGDHFKIQQQATQGDSLKCMEVVETCILADDTINCIFCIDGIAAPAAYAVLEEHDLAEDVFIVGIDDTDEQIDMIRDGKLYGVTYGSFYKQAYQSCMWIMDYIQDGTVPEYVYNDVGTMMINAENVDSYKEIANDKSSWTNYEPIPSLYPDGDFTREEY